MDCSNCKKRLINYCQKMSNGLYSPVCDECHKKEFEIQCDCDSCGKQGYSKCSTPSPILSTADEETTITKCFLCDGEPLQKTNICNECIDIVYKDFVHEKPKADETSSFKTMLNLTETLLTDIKKLKDQRDKLKRIVQNKIINI